MNHLYHIQFFNDEELFNAAVDEKPLSEETRSHLEQCERCQKSLAEYKTVNALLLSSLYRYHCPSSMKLSFYSADLLLVDEMLSVRDHLRECPLCVAEVEETQLFLAESAPLC